jgi:acyl-coenzyme A synthetase/AMP-(fatty) acid ligase
MSLVTEKQANTALAIDRSISDNKGDQLALRYRDKRYSYNDLAALMNRAGNMLRKHGVAAGDQIIVAVSASPSLVASVLGATKIGATAVVASAGASGQAVAGLDNAKLLIVDAPRLSEFDGIGLKRLVVGDAEPDQLSFLQEMRSSSSSLGFSSDRKDAPAFGIVSSNKVIWFGHDQIANADSALEQFDIGRILARLIRGEDAALA